MATKKAARKPRSQSEIASEKRARALEDAGTAILEGKPGKAKRVLDEASKAKKPTPRQAVEVLSEAHSLELQLQGIEHKIEGVRETYKELKAQREVLVSRIRAEVRDMGQGRLPFSAEAAVEEDGAGAALPDEIERELADAPRA